ncbi:uncharacterized protein LOC131663215 [Phymastichus coffea]|uniref:uncharacterized protein LOC131663215 n=1 Tax=Phymastichus coffea TaxID=108790 RepID=UPI00273B3B73|nr:uncharacterized protein LOC131663215 [Phymastichus coffea]XP_058789443.1 uncharacterized protein LOC131663215 [Phymastichus coffea]
MSCLAKSQFKYLSSNNINKFHLADSDEDNDEFNFQFVPVNQFKNIVKDVKRQRTRNKEEQAWTTFIKEQNQLDINCKQPYSDEKYKPNRTLAESFRDVDKELLRLEIDTLPQSKYNSDCSSSKNQRKHSVAKLDKKNSLLKKKDRIGSANLLTIPEEKKHYYTMESPIHYNQCGHTLKKSRSDQTMKNTRLHSKFCYSTDNLDYNLSPHSDLSFHDNDTIPVRPDPVAVAKILNIQRKIFTVLNSISYELDRIPLPDGDDDFLRRHQRIIEFSTRLSRNYLYELSRQISDIQRHIKAISPDNKMKLNRRGIIFHMQIIEQKLISTHQLLLTALSAYWKHIPSSVLKSHPGKLKDLLQTVLELKNICTEIKLTPDFYCSGDNRDTFLGNETENQCTSILNRFRPISDNESQVPSHRTRSTAATPSRGKKLKNRNRQIALSNRFNMYAVDMRLGKNSHVNKTRSVFQIPKNKDRSYVSVKQCQSSILPQSKKSLLSIEKISKETITNKSSKINVPLKEDDIETMMETVLSDFDIESCKSVKTSKKHKIRDKTHQPIHIQISSKESDKRLNKNRIDHIGEEKLIDNTQKQTYSSSLLPLIDLLSLIHNREENTSLPLASIDTFYDFLKTCQSKVEIHEFEAHSVRDEKKCGEKNMQLICYASKENNKNNITKVEESEDSSKFNDAACRINCAKRNATYELSVSESVVSSLTDYRNEYQNMIKSNPLYTSNTQNKPWEVVSWIADKLVDELIVELCDDFQIEDVIKKLFELEFKEF